MDGIVEDLTRLVGRTPLLRLRRLSPGAEVCGKLEYLNPGGSVKDRAALQMITEAEESGRLKPGSTIIEASSGNTGISLAMLAAARGYRCIIVMPEDMSLARRQILKALGAEVVLTNAELGMTGAVERAAEVADATSDAFVARQFQNPANAAAHFEHTGQEIWSATEGEIAAFVAGVGTGGTLTGVGRFLRQRRPDIEIIAVEPAGSAVLSGGEPGLHGIQGLGAGFIPDILDRDLITEVIQVKDQDAYRYSERLAREEGLLAGPSAGANVCAAVQVGHRLGKGKRVVTILCDGYERYLS